VIFGFLEFEKVFGQAGLSPAVKGSSRGRAGLIFVPNNGREACEQHQESYLSKQEPAALASRRVLHVPASSP
jgi:hypothetical protein